MRAPFLNLISPSQLVTMGEKKGCCICSFTEDCSNISALLRETEKSPPWLADLTPGRGGEQRTDLKC